MKIVFTKHSIDRLRLRSITRHQVLRCVMEPTVTNPAKDQRKAVLRLFGNRYLKVVVAERVPDTFVITAYWVAKSRVES